jgi:hypothetical protein
MVGLLDAGCVKILADLAKHVVVAGFLEIGDNDRFGIGVRLVARLAQLFGRPQAKELVAARRGLEAQFLVQGELALEPFLRRRIYEGKAKILYEGPEPGTLIQFFKDDATAFNKPRSTRPSSTARAC